MHLMADAVARRRVVQAELAGRALQEDVVVRVLEVRLEHVVIHVADRQLGLHTRNADGLELQVGHCAGRVLGQGLVNADADLRSFPQLALDDMRGDDLLGNSVSHDFSLYVCVMICACPCAAALLAGH